MGSGRNNGREEFTEVYAPNQVESVLEYCDIEISYDTSTHFLAFCPFHGNTDSPAFAVDKQHGLFHCFNPSCMISGTLVELLMRLKKLNSFEALRVIIKFRDSDSTPFSDRLKEAMAQPVEFVSFPSEPLDRMYEDFKGSVGEEYMHSRGFLDETLDFFRVGYSKKNNMVIVPMHDPNGMPIGLIGRTPSHTDKTFKNSTRLPKSKTAWNFHRAKKCGDTVIVCEASYDAMRIHQAGYPNVIALLGGYATSFHINQINKHFSTVVIMTDFDLQYNPNCRACGYAKCVGHRPGRDLGRSLAAGLSNKRILWGAYDDTCVFPRGVKDACAMADEEIRQCLKNSVSNLTYSMWNIEQKTLALGDKAVYNGSNRHQ